MHTGRSRPACSRHFWPKRAAGEAPEQARHLLCTARHPQRRHFASHHAHPAPMPAAEACLRLLQLAPALRQLLAEVAHEARAQRAGAVWRQRELRGAAAVRLGPILGKGVGDAVLLPAGEAEERSSRTKGQEVRRRSVQSWATEPGHRAESVRGSPSEPAGRSRAEMRLIPGLLAPCWRCSAARRGTARHSTARHSVGPPARSPTRSPGHGRAPWPRGACASAACAPPRRGPPARCAPRGRRGPPGCAASAGMWARPRAAPCGAGWCGAGVRTRPR